MMAVSFHEICTTVYHKNRLPYVKLTGELAQKVATIAELMREQAAFSS